MKWQTRLLMLLAGSVFLYALGSGRLPLMGPDEPRYSQVAREMLDRGDFITPTLGGMPWFEKPVLLYWLQAIGYALFGVNELSARLPSIVSAVFTIWIVTWTMRKLTRDEPALISGLALATSLFFIGFGHAATFDMLLTACVTASLCFFLLHEMDRRPKWLWLGYGFAGLGVLAKGFVAPLIIGLTMCLYLLVSGKIRNLKEYRLAPGILISVAIASLWLLPVTLIHGAEFWNDFFLQHHLMRYTTSHYHRSGGLLYYIPVFLIGSYPWTPALFLKTSSFRSATPLRRMAWCWFAGTFVFFSLSQSKLPGYILPLMPAFAMIAGLSLYDAFRFPRRASILFVVVHSLVVATLFVATKKLPVAASPEVLIAIAGVALLAAAAVWLLRRNRLSPALAANALIPCVLVFLALFWFYPKSDLDETRNLAAAVRPELGKSGRLLLYNVYDFPMVFYTNAHVVLTYNGYFVNVKTPHDLFFYLKHHGESHVMVRNEDLAWIRRENALRIENIMEGPRHSIVLVSLQHEAL